MGRSVSDDSELSQPRATIIQHWAKHPSRHNTLVLCWSNAGPPSTTLAQHWINIGPTYWVKHKSPLFVTRWVAVLMTSQQLWLVTLLLSSPWYSLSRVLVWSVKESRLYVSSNPANTKHFYNICTILDQRRRRWPELYKCLKNVLCLLGMLLSMQVKTNSSNSSSEK